MSEEWFWGRDTESDYDGTTNGSAKLSASFRIAWNALRDAVTLDEIDEVISNVEALEGDGSGNWSDDRAKFEETPKDKLLAALRGKRRKMEHTNISGMSEGEVAEVAAEEALASFAYTSGAGWLRYRDGAWRFVGAQDVREALRRWAVGRHRSALLDQADAIRRASDAPKGDKTADAQAAGVAKAMETRVARSRQLAGKVVIDHLSGLAQGLLSRPLTDFDANPYILAAPNGVVDLRTGEMRLAGPETMNTKVAGANYVPGATHTDWERALDALPDDARDWLQIRLGQALTGLTPPDDSVMFWMGGGSNGKSTILDGVMAAMGDYADIVPDRSLMAINSAEGHSTELMVFKGLRLAIMEEAPGDGRRVNVSALKKIVGTSKIKARLIGRDNETFTTTHALIITSNHNLSIEEQDHGTWRRWLKVPFGKKFAGTSLDRGLKPRIQRDPRVHEAVLAWLVAGAQRALSEGWPEPPESVRAATQSWRATTDAIGQWLEDEGIEFEVNAFTPTEVLLTSFNLHGERNGRRAMGDRLWMSRLMEHPWVIDAVVTDGRKLVDGKKARGLHGIRMPDTSPAPGVRLAH